VAVGIGIHEVFESVVRGQQRAFDGTILATHNADVASAGALRRKEHSTANRADGRCLPCLEHRV